METISISLKSCSPGFWCVYSMYGNTQRMRRLHHCVCLKQSLRDSRSVCVPHFILMLYASLLSHSSWIIHYDKREVTPMYKIYKVLYSGWWWEFCSHRKKVMTYFLQSSQLLFFLFKYSVTLFSLRDSPSPVLLKLIVHKARWQVFQPTRSPVWKVVYLKV